jgi:hypothetical protein
MGVGRVGSGRNEEDSNHGALYRRLVQRDPAVTQGAEGGLGRLVTQRFSNRDSAMSVWSAFVVDLDDTPKIAAVLWYEPIWSGCSLPLAAGDDPAARRIPKAPMAQLATASFKRSWWIRPSTSVLRPE